jgi:hypothetical protein
LGALGVRCGADVLGFQAWLEILTGVGMLSFVATRRSSAIGPFIWANGCPGLLAGILSVAGYLAYLAAAQVLAAGAGLRVAREQRYFSAR